MKFKKIIIIFLSIFLLKNTFASDYELTVFSNHNNGNVVKTHKGERTVKGFLDFISI